MFSINVDSDLPDRYPQSFPQTFKISIVKIRIYFRTKTSLKGTKKFKLSKARRKVSKTQKK